MFDKLSVAAEKLATNVSRRGFFGSLGRWAGAAALAMAGVLTTGSSARADGAKTCCEYCWGLGCYEKCYVCVSLGSPCPAPPFPCNLFYQAFTVQSCGHCK